MAEAEREPMVQELLGHQSIFIGFKVDTGLRRQIESLEGPDKKYVSQEDSTFLRLCKLGDDLYVGKVIDERLTTDRVDDVRRNVFSILNRLFPETRLPQDLEILGCRPDLGS
jgi:hypothetical protein